MINIGDTVKVIGKTLDGSGEEVELIPIGTICRVENIDDDENGRFVKIIPINRNTKDGYISHWGYWYKEDDLEKGHMEWIKDESEDMNMTDEYFYELYYFHSRKDSGSLYAKSDKNLKDFLGEDEFLNYLMEIKEITYHEAQSIIEVIEITKMEYEDFQ